MRFGSRAFFDNDFTKTILSWDFEVYEHPLPDAEQKTPLPNNSQNINEYYENFIPFILEEARSVIADGLVKANEYIAQAAQPRKKRTLSHLSDAQPFSLVLKSDARYPKNEGNPLYINFRGAIPRKVEHGKSMIALLLKTKNITPEKHFIGLATENQDSTELSVKIILSSEDYYACSDCFVRGGAWEAHYLGSVISQQRMHEVCLESTDLPSIRQIARANIPRPRTTKPDDFSTSLDRLNLSQRQAIYGFFNAPTNSTLLLEGPPGTGKTTTLVSLLDEAASEGSRTLVSAHSNKGVQVLASRALMQLPDVPMILVGVESKLPQHLKAIFLNRWHDTIAGYFSEFTDEIESLSKNSEVGVGIAQDKLLEVLTNSIEMAESALDKFSLLFSSELEDEAYQDLLSLSENPINTEDFERLKQNLHNLKTSSPTAKKWKALAETLALILDKWNKIDQASLENHLLDYADIVFATLITCGRKNLKNMSPFDYLLVDEASQAVEAETLIPIQFQPDKILLVGDTKQLPATVISPLLDESSDTRNGKHYKWSMMWRLIQENHAPHLMLTIQYRMHTQICQWPSERFYNNQLVTSPSIIPMPLLSQAGVMARPYAVYEVAGQVDQPSGSKSVTNSKEADYIVEIIGAITRERQDISIGVITPYVAQKQLLTQKLTQRGLLSLRVDINTVDSFQGDERDVIILSFVRTHVSQFLKEFRRLNVAITRPKACLIILAAPTLRSHDIGALIRDARQRNLVYSEQSLQSILSTGRLPGPAAASSGEDLRDRALRGEADGQFAYGKQLVLQNPAMARVWQRRAAENGHPAAQFALSKVYFLGDAHTGKDVELGLQWIQKSANANFLEAQFALGRHLVLGTQVQRDIDLGLHWLTQAANNDHIGSLIFMAESYESGSILRQNTAKAIIHYRSAAKLNHIEAIMPLANMLSQGSENNKREAIKWYKKAAEKNITRSYYPLAQLLNALSKNPSDALPWYVRAADAGNSDAQYDLGLRLKNGLYNTEIDLPKALQYLMLAANSKHIDAAYLFAMHLKTGDGINQDTSRAIYYFKESAKQGHIESCYEAGMLLKEIDAKSAFDFFKKAACKNHLDAQYEAACLKERAPYDSGYNDYLEPALKGHVLAQLKCIQIQVDERNDLRQCLIFCENISTQKGGQYPQVIYLLARLLDTGITKAPNTPRAYTLYNSLLEKEHPLSIYQCGKRFEEGLDVNKDLFVAERLYRRCHNIVPEAKLRLACLLLSDSTISNCQQPSSNQAPEEEQIETEVTSGGLMPCLPQVFFSSSEEPLTDRHFARRLSAREQEGLELLRNYLAEQKAPATICANTDDEKTDQLIYALAPSTSILSGKPFEFRSIEGNYLLGQILELRSGPSIHIHHALYYYEKAGVGFPDAHYRIGRIYERGHKVRADWPTARSYYQKAADKEHEFAKKRLTWSYAWQSREAPLEDSALEENVSNCLVM